MSSGAHGGRRRSAGALLRHIALDFSPLRVSRDFRLLEAGQVVSGVGSQIALVALPTQIYLLSHSAALVGLLGLFELGPMVVASLFGGALTLLLIQFRLLPLPAVLARQKWILRLHEKGGGVPYGIALAAAALVVYPETGWMKVFGA